MAVAKADLQKSITEYLNPTDRFAARLKASMT